MSILLRTAVRSLCLNNLQHLNSLRCGAAVQQNRSVGRHVAAIRLEINSKKKYIGSNCKNTNRSAYAEWNFPAEVYSFGARLGENFRQDLLTEAFTQRSYVAQKEYRRESVANEESQTNPPLIERGKEKIQHIVDNYVLYPPVQPENADGDVQEPHIHMNDCNRLAKKGEEIIRKYVDAFVRYHLQLAPDDVVKAVKDYLLSTEKLAEVSLGLGTKDIILADSYPVNKEVLAQTFHAVVGALAESQIDGSLDRPYNFVRDFICTQLNQVDVNDIWNIQKPYERLQSVCAERGIKSIEPRIIGELAKNTILASCRIAIYDAETKKQLGSGAGESIENALEIASIDALARIFGTHNLRPFNFRIGVDEVFNQNAVNKKRMSAS